MTGGTANVTLFCIPDRWFFKIKPTFYMQELMLLTIRTQQMCKTKNSHEDGREGHKSERKRSFGRARKRKRKRYWKRTASKEKA